jgi:hypothetical protein
MSLPLRFLRALLSAVLFLMIGVLVMLLLVSGLSTVSLSDDSLWKAVGWFALVATIGCLVALYFINRWLREKPWSVLAAGYIIVAPVFVYAAYDDAEFKRPLTLAELSPSPARAEESWRITLWYSPRPDQPAERTMPNHNYVPGAASDPEKWATHLEKNREKVLQAWNTLAKEREWFAAMNAFPAIGDLMPARYDGPLIRFRPFRAVVQVCCARAGLLALDGRGDDAVDELLPVLEVSRKLEPSARSLVRFMVARASLGTIGDATRFVLARARVSAAKRAALATALEGGSGGTAGVRRLLWIEYAFHYEALLAEGGLEGFESGDGSRKRVMLAMTRPFFLRRATANSYAANLEELTRLAERREFSRFDAQQREFANEQVRGRFKNIVGGLLLHMSMPSYHKVVETYWTKEDERLALIAELRKPV